MTHPNRATTGESPSRERIKVGPESLTQNEIAWLEFLRLSSKGSDPTLTLRRVHLLRRVCEPRRA